MRPHRPTSKAAYESVKHLREGLFQKIIEGLGKLKTGGTHEQIANASGLEPQRVWKRLSEMSRVGLIYEVGVTRPLSSGRKGMVWQLKRTEKIKQLTTTSTNPLFEI